MEIPGQGEWRKSRQMAEEGYAATPVDAVEKLIQEKGIEGAFDIVKENLEKNPEDPEAKRQAALLANRFKARAQELEEGSGPAIH